MVYKKYLKKGGKIFGPYYYESYRESNHIKKIYIGGEDEYREWIKTRVQKPLGRKPGIIVEQPGRRIGFAKVLLFVSLALLFISILFVFGITFSEISNSKYRLTGFAIAENISDNSGMNSGLVYSKIESETITQSIDTFSVDLEVKEPAMFEGQAISENKNKRMDFDTPDGGIRLYFDLLNYSQFVENLAGSVNLTENYTFAEENVDELNLTEINITEELEITNNLTVNATIPETDLSNVTVNETIILNNQTEEDINQTQIIENQTTEQPAEQQPSENQTPKTPIQEQPSQEQPVHEIEQPSTEEITEPSQTQEQIQQPASEPGITGNIIRILGFPFKLIQGLISFTGRVIGIENSSEINESVQLNQSYSYAKEINLANVREKSENLSSNEIKEIADNSVVNAESFDVVVNETQSQLNATPPSYKWGYKVKLNDLKFIAKIDVTSNQSISKYDDYTLQIGNNLLSFRDLIERGYTVRINTPSLEMNVSLGAENRIISEGVCTENCSVTEDVTINETLPESVVEINTTNVTEQNLSEENLTQPAVNITIPENITEESEENQTHEQEQSPATDKEEQKEEKKQEKKEEKVQKEEQKQDDEKNKEEKTDDKNSKKESKNKEGVTGNIVKIFAIPFGIVGRVVEEVANATGIGSNPADEGSNLNIIVPDTEYNYTVSVYIERDFREYVNASNINNSINETASSIIDEAGNISESEQANATDVSQILEINNTESSSESQSSQIGITGNAIKNKKEKGSNGMVKPNTLSVDCNIDNKQKYLNVSVDNLSGCAGMAEWSTQSIVSGCPSGCVGSIPTAGATSQNKKSITGNAVGEIDTNISNVNDNNIVNGANNEEGTASNSFVSGQIPLILGQDFEDIDGNGVISIGDIVYLDPTLTTITYTLNSASESYNNITYEQNFTHLEVIGDTSSKWRGFNYTGAGRTAYPPYFADDDNSYLELDGVNDYVNISSAISPAFENNVTISLWAKVIVHGSSTLIFDKGYTSWASPYYQIQIYDVADGATLDRLQIQVINSTGSAKYNYVTAGSLFTKNIWHQLTLSYWRNGTNGNTLNISFYVDGVLLNNTQTDFGNYTNWNTGFALGRAYAGSTTYWNGSIDNVLILNRSLNSTEVFSLYSLGRKDTSYSDASLVSAYRFDNTNISVAQDTIGTNNGTLRNEAQYGYDALGLVAYYPFDVQENVLNNKTYDYSRNNNDGTLFNGTSRPTFNSTGCIYGNCYTFDSLTEYISMGTGSSKNIIVSDNMTFSYWIYPVGWGTSNRSILFEDSSTDDGFTFWGSGTTLAYFGSVIGGSDGYDISIPIADIQLNKWTNFVIVYSWNGSSVIVNTYQNGVADVVNRNTGEGRMVANYNFYISGVFSGRSWNGSLDEIMIFNTALNSSQISDIYNNQSQRFKNPGTQTLKQVNISSGYNQVNLTTQFNTFMGSNISGRVGEWDVSLGYNNSDMDSSLNGLVSYWYLDEASWNGTSGEVKDAMGLNNGTAMNSTNYANTTANGVYYRAGSFNGISNFVNMTIAQGVTSHSLWQKNSTASSWTFVAYNGSTFFTNAVIGLIAQYPINITGTTTKTVKIGFNYTGNQLFNGSIDEVMIFNRSLSADEVKELYVKGRAKWNYGAWQNLSASGNNFSISRLTTNLLPDFTHYTGNSSANAFYSPNLGSTSATPVGMNVSEVVNGCMNLNEENYVYTLQNNINTGSTCFNVTANNVTLDLNGYWINDTTPAQDEYGVTTAYNQTTVKNGAIYYFARGIDSSGFNGNYTNMTIYTSGNFGLSSTVSGIYLSSNNSHITNSNVTMINNAGGSSFGYGIYLSTSSNNQIINNIANSNRGSTGSGAGIYLESSSNNTLTNNTANSNSGLSGYGFYLTSSSNNNLTGNTANSNTNDGISLSSSLNNTIIGNTANSNLYGIHLTGSSNNTVQNNIVNNNLNSFEGSGIYFQSSSNNQIINNTANSNMAGIYLTTSSNNTFTNNNIWNCTDTEFGCVYLLISSSNNLFQGGLINLSSSNLVKTESSAGLGPSNNIFKDITLLGATTNDVYFYGLGSVNNTFINVSYNSSKEYVTSGSQLIRKWYYRAYVNDTAGIAVNNANVTAYNVSGSYNFNLTTNASGWTGIENIIDYVNTGAVSGVNRTYYSLYTLYAKNASYSTGSKSYNATLNTNNLGDVITLIAPGNVTVCGVFDLANTVYTQTASIIPTGSISSCINITASNVTLNCNGFFIRNTTLNVPGIYAGNNLVNITIKNCNVTMSSIGDSVIKFNSVNDSLIINNTANSNSNGIYLSYSSNNQLINNTANSNNYGIWLYYSPNNNITGNTANLNLAGIVSVVSDYNLFQNIIINNNTARGLDYGYSTTVGGSHNRFINITANSNPQLIRLYGGVNNTFVNISIWNCTDASYGCVYLLSTSQNNTFTGGLINLSSSNLIYLTTNSDNNIFKDIILLGATKNDTLLTLTSINNTFINVSYNSSKEYVASGSQLIRKGYFTSVTANVTYIGNASQLIAGENVSLKDSTGSVLNSNVSIANGQAKLSFASPQLYTFYTNNGGTRTGNIYLYTTNSSLPYLSQTTDFTWTNLLNDDGAINNEVQDVRMRYSTYTLAGTQTLHDVYNNVNDNSIFINLSSVSVPCRYVANMSIDVTGSLIIENCILEVESESGSYKTISVNSGGSLRMNYSNITTYDTTTDYYFYSLSDSSITIKNSYISYVGVQRSAYLQGPAFNSSNFVFYNNSLYKNMESLVLLAPNMTVNNSILYDSTAELGGNNLHVYSTGAKIIDSNISKPKVLYADIKMEPGADLSIVNSNYSSVSLGTGATLTRIWWYQAFVNDTAGNLVSGANVTAYNVSNAYQFNFTTNASGWIPKTELIDYVQNSTGTKTYYSNYTIYARNSSYTYIASSSINVTSQNNINKDVFTLDNAPVVKIISATSSAYTYNATDDNAINNCSLILGGGNVATDTSVNKSGATETISYSAGDGTHTYYISCIDEFGNVGNSTTSTNTISTTTVTTSSGGGGGGTTTKTVSLKIETPSISEAPETGEINIPIALNNNGQVDLNKITVSGYVLKDSKLSNIKPEFDKTYFSSIAVGKEEKINLKVVFDKNEIAFYDIIINASAESPVYKTSNHFYVDFLSKNASGVKKMIVFADNLLVENPQCLELKEMVDEAKKLLDEGNLKDATITANKAIESCKKSVSGPQNFIFPLGDKGLGITFYLIMATIASILFGVLFYFYRIWRFRKRKI